MLQSSKRKENAIAMRERSAVTNVSHCKRSKMAAVAAPSHRNEPMTITSQGANNKPDIHIRCHQASTVMAFQKSKLLVETSICDPTIDIRNASKTCWIWTRTTEAKIVGHIVRTKAAAKLLQSMAEVQSAGVSTMASAIALILTLPL